MLSGGSPKPWVMGESGEAVFTRTQLRLLQGEYLISKPNRSNAAGGWSCVLSLASSRSLNSRTNYLIMFLLCFSPSLLSGNYKPEIIYNSPCLIVLPGHLNAIASWRKCPPSSWLSLRRSGKRGARRLPSQLAAES